MREDIDPEIHKMPLIILAKDEGDTKGSNFISPEDLVLCKVYVAASLNPIKGANQKEHKLWNDVKTRYTVLLQESTNPQDVILIRDRQSLKLRYKRHIQPSMSKLMKFYRECHANKKSGETNEDIIEKASETYCELERHAFKFNHCVRYLKESGLPQFNPGFTEEEVDDIEKGIAKANAVANAADDNIMSAGMKRQQGNKSAKASENLMKERKQAKTVKSKQIGEMVESNKIIAHYTHQMAFAVSNRREVENLISMANMFFKIGEINKAKENMELAEKERQNVATPLSFATSSFAKTINSNKDSSVPKEITIGLKTTGEEEKEEEKEEEEDKEENNEDSLRAPDEAMNAGNIIAEGVEEDVMLLTVRVDVLIWNVDGTDATSATSMLIILNPVPRW